MSKKEYINKINEILNALNEKSLKSLFYFLCEQDIFKTKENIDKD